MMNGVAAVGVSCRVLWSGILLMTGSELPAAPMVKLQPFAIWPELVLRSSSTTYKDQVPFGFVPLNTDNEAPYGAAGAGDTNTSDVSKLVGLNEPEAGASSSGRELAAASSKVKFTLLTGVWTTSDMRITFGPAGPTSRMSRSAGKECVKPLRVTTNFPSVSDCPDKMMVDG